MAYKPFNDMFQDKKRKEVSSLFSEIAKERKEKGLDKEKKRKMAKKMMKKSFPELDKAAEGLMGLSIRKK